MATAINLRKLLHRPQWEMCSPTPVANAAGAFWESLTLDAYNIRSTFQAASTTQVYFYDSIADGYIQTAAFTIATALGVGACGKITPISVERTATGGTTSTIITNLTIPRDLRGYKIRITYSTNTTAAGQELTILSNTLGANSTITVATQGTAFTSATKYQLLTPNFYVVGSGVLATNTFSRYDWAINTWAPLANTNLPGTIATDSMLIATPGIVGGAFDSSATGGYAFSAAGATTITITGSAWATNQWKNSQIRITGGLGAGQVRTISTNTTVQLTVSAAWSVNPDGTSTWVIEGNDDYIYYLGSAVVTAVRYSISGLSGQTINTWVSLATTGGTARAAAPGVGMSASWITGCTDTVTGTAWNNKNAIKNGRYIYSFRGGASAVLDIMDIAGGDTTGTTISWAATVQAYGNQSETFSTGMSWEYDGRDTIYGVLGVANLPARAYRFSIVTNDLLPMWVMNYPQGTIGGGHKVIVIPYIDGGTRVDFLYHWKNLGTEVFRTIVSPFIY